MTLQLHSYYRSSAAWRVRIALAFKGLSAETLPVHLTRNGGEQRSPAYTCVNPEKLVPTLQDDSVVLSQSLAILEYLEERHPTPALLPQDAGDRGWVRALAAQMACDIHPLNNLRVLQYLEGPLGVSARQKQDWIAHWTTEGLAALETRLAGDGHSGTCCFGDTPTFADCCLAPQVYHARRFNVALEAFPTVVRIDAHLAGLPAFQRAVPAAQPDAE